MRIAIILVGLSCTALLFGASLATSNTSPAQQAAAPIKIGESGLPIPRFVSLKADRVNVRKGPSRTHDISWIFNREGLPVEIIAEFKNWRQVRDSDGAEGWVFHSLLSGRRTAVIAPWLKDDTIPLLSEDDRAGAIVARAEPGVVGQIHSCNGTWCRIDVGDLAGWVEQSSLWGVYPGETVE